MEVKVTGQDEVTGLPKFRKLKRYTVDLENETIELIYSEYQKTPTGEIVLFEEKPFVMKNESPELQNWDANKALFNVQTVITEKNKELIKDKEPWSELKP